MLISPSQIARHVKKKHALRVYVFHGAGKKQMTPKDLNNYDCVITTYQTLASDYAPSKATLLPSSGLYSLKWRRIILDEGHTVRNPYVMG